MPREQVHQSSRPHPSHSQQSSHTKHPFNPAPSKASCDPLKQNPARPYRCTQTPQHAHTNTQRHTHTPTPTHCAVPYAPTETSIQPLSRRPGARLPGWATWLRGAPALDPRPCPTHPQRSRRSASQPKACTRPHRGHACRAPGNASTTHPACWAEPWCSVWLVWLLFPVRVVATDSAVLPAFPTFLSLLHMPSRLQAQPITRLADTSLHSVA